jgi:hypothetical protein
MSRGPFWPPLALAAALGFWTAGLAQAADPWCFLDYVNLAFHEAGHIVFAPFGATIARLGGTLGQLLVPASLAVWFVVKEGRPAAAAFTCWWFGENLLNVARYMADARELALPLVGGGDHDWNELFFRFNLLNEPAVVRIAGATRGAGVCLMVAGLAWLACFGLPEGTRAHLRESLSRRAPVLGNLLH